MDKQIQKISSLDGKITINYQQIFKDILKKKYPEKNKDCSLILNKENLSAIDIIELNKKIFGTDKETEHFNQKHRSYCKTDILKILDYQKKNKLNNTQLSIYFKLSRNTITKWKKMFLT